MDSINKKQVGARIKDIRLSLGESVPVLILLKVP